MEVNIPKNDHEPHARVARIAAVNEHPLSYRLISTVEIVFYLVVFFFYNPSPSSLALLLSQS